jgi:hypothetical protein
MTIKLAPILLTTEYQNIVTGPVGAEASIHGLVITNVSTANATFDLRIFKSNSNISYDIATGLNVFAKSAYSWPRPINLETGDILSMRASVNSALTVIASIYENTTIKQGFTPRGEWNSGTNYDQNDIVTYNSSSYIASSVNINQQPDTSSATWTLLSSPGFTGSQGIGGFVGSQGTQGSIGFTGSQGVIGFTGSQGAIGFTGSQGVIGFTGSQGAIGFTGSRGVSGIVVSATAPISPALYDIWLDIS